MTRVSTISAQQGVSLRGLGIGLEIGLCAVLLIIFSEGFVTRLIAPEQEVDGSIILRLMWLPVYGFIGLLAIMRARSFVQVLWRSPFLLILIGLAAASFLWSIDPALSQRRGIAIGFTTLFGFYLAARFGWREMLVLFGSVWLFLAAVSLIAGVIAPEFARMQEVHTGAWRGMWWEKNAMGGHMARASFLFMFLSFVDTRRRKFWIAGLILSVALVLLSTSKTALLGTLLGIAVILVGSWMRRGAATALSVTWVGVSVVGAIGVALVFAPETVFGMIGRDASLTGRTDIWRALAHTISERPWLGYGYGAFWPVESEPAYWVRKAVDWPAPTAHNGWLDTWLSLGLIGVCAFTFSFVLALLRGLARAARGWFGIFALGFLAQFALFSLSESIVLQQNAIIWVTFAAVAGRLALDARHTSSQSAGPSRPARPIFQARRPIKSQIVPPKQLPDPARRKV